MDQIYPDEGLIDVLKSVANGKDGGGLTWALFLNDITPTLDSLKADFTLAATGWTDSGATIDATAFTLGAVDTHIGTIQAANIFFTNATGVSQDAYGYIVYDGDDKIVAAARFDDAPRVITNGAQTFVVPVLGDYSGLPA